MPLRYAVPKKFQKTPEATSLVCTRITILPTTNTIIYEFDALNMAGKQVGHLNTETRYGVDVKPDDEIIRGVTARQVRDAIKAHAYATAQAEIGTGVIE